METQMHTHRMGLNPFLTFYIDAMLNFDGDVDANANVKCEHTVTEVLLLTIVTYLFDEDLSLPVEILERWRHEDADGFPVGSADD